MGMRRSDGNRVHVCRVCGNEFRRWTDTAVYCSRVCMTADYRERNTGAGNPAWRGGKWKYKGRSWAAVAERVIERDRVCADCGTGERLIAHHLIPQRFWLDLDRANELDNLLTLCSPCHVKRPEHYWVVVPPELWSVDLHVSEPPRRTSKRLRHRPKCAICGEPCKQHRNRYCSYACSNRARWESGLFNAEASIRNLGGDPAAAARKGLEVRRNIARLRKSGTEVPGQVIFDFESGKPDTQPHEVDGARSREAS